TPGTAYVHSAQVRFEVVDGTPANRAPSANDDSTMTSEDSSVSIALAANDSDPDGDTLAYTITSSPAHGSLDATNPANPIYTPNANFFGSDGFSYSVSDGRGGSDTASVSISVISSNDPPVVADDALAVSEDASGSVDVTANDSDVDSTLVVSAASDGSHGSVSFSGGTVTYTPVANYSGADQFTVTVTDGTTIATSTVFVTVAPVADSPVARDDSGTLDEDGAIWIAGLANDSDDDGDGLTITSVTPASNGYAWWHLDQLYYSADANFHGSDSFTYTVSDGNGEVGTATVHLTVNSINDAPVAQADSASGSEDEPLAIDAVSNDTDVDGDFVAISGHGGASHGSVSIVDNKLVYTPAANFHGSDSVTYTIEDPQGGFSSAMVSITIAPANDAPVASDQSTVIGSSKKLTLVAADTDGDSLTYSVVDGPAHGTLSNAAGSQVTYTREAGYTGDDSFTFKANDGGADSNVATVSITVIEPSVGAVIDAGFLHTCSVRTDATLWCWGYGGHGQLGMGNSAEQSIPAQVGTEAVWSTVATGAYHTCATKLDGSLWCWGADWYGQLGNGDPGDSYVPTQVDGSEYVAVAAGTYHTCATKSDNTLWCWGYNEYGEVGNEDRWTSHQAPTQVGGGSDWQTIAAGHYHSCATKTDNTLWCWGANWIGQAGLGTSVHSTGTPAQIGSETSWTKVDANGDHSCSLRADDSLWCWGHNGHGELGDATNESRWEPVRVGAEDVEWASTGLGTYHSCATRTDDSLWCWGRNYRGSLGDASNTDRNVPGQVGTDTSWSSVTGGEVHSCGVKDGVTQCWGSNENRQLGIGSSFIERTPKTVEGGAVTAVATGQQHSCAVRADGSLWCWGHNGNGQLGTGDTADAAGPRRVGSDTWKRASMGWHHSCAIKSDDSLWCWGYGGHGALGTGDGSSSSVPVAVAPGTTWQSVEANGIHSCAVKSDSTLWCWGYNGHGQLGDGTYAYQFSPVQVGTDTVSSVATQYHHSCAIKSDATLWCWGYNGWGNLGDGTYNQSATPVQVPGSWSTVAVGHLHTCATQADDSLWCWGHGGHGALGNGSYNESLSPQRVGTDADWVSVDAGNYHSCARKSDDTLWCWGGGGEGQLGNGNRETQPAPGEVGGEWLTVELGGHHSCGVRTDQTLACWGYNYHGQVGLPGYVGSYLPMPVADSPSGLLSYYTGEYNANDTAGTRHGSLSGDAYYTTGVRNNAFRFNGNGQFIASATGLPSGNAARTVMAWVRVDAAAATEAFFAGYGSFSGDAAFSLSANTAFGASFSSGSTATVGGLLRLGHWHHVAATSSGNTVTLFVDGVQVATGTHALATAADQSLLLGMLDSDHRLQGAMDEIRIYDRALTAEQIALVHSVDD
ncbi:MAG TPA: Ig-like domain-containing protein, partial [Kofleriaceae bacterium]